MLSLAMLGAATHGNAQVWGDRQDRRDRRVIARDQGVPPGHLPPANLCRVWYDNRPNGQQPAATYCREAELIASRNRNARVIYGENVYSGYPDRYPGDRAVDRDRDVNRVPGRNRDPYGDRLRYTTPAFQNGYRDGLDKGRNDGDDNDRFDVTRHDWYRSATRGYENEYGSRSSYQTMYREGFERGYADGYRATDRR
jgi:hypothetical protein